MIALDTNVLVRFLVMDDAKQAALAAKLINRAIADDAGLFVADIVVCELVWVLSFAYKFTRPEITVALRDLLRARELTFGASDQLHPAVMGLSARMIAGISTAAFALAPRPPCADSSARFTLAEPSPAQPIAIPLAPMAAVSRKRRRLMVMECYSWKGRSKLARLAGTSQIPYAL
jgi:predicted nucleic-acid-binding protein